MRGGLPRQPTQPELMTARLTVDGFGTTMCRTCRRNAYAIKMDGIDTGHYVCVDRHISRMSDAFAQGAG